MISELLVAFAALQAANIREFFHLFLCKAHTTAALNLLIRQLDRFHSFSHRRVVLMRMSFSFYRTGRPAGAGLL